MDKDIFSGGISFPARQLREPVALIESICAVQLADRCSELIADLANKPKPQLDDPMQRFLSELIPYPLAFRRRAIRRKTGTADA